MAEIKSTLELVMEKAARLGTATDQEIREQRARENGMRLASVYVSAGEDHLPSLLEKEPAEVQMATRRGMIDTLLRNILLPREELQQQRVNRALEGIVELGGKAGDIVSICRDLEHIARQYIQHRTQLRQQLEEQVRMQYEQLLSQQAGLSGGELKIDPTMQPKFKEEWNRIETELDAQYNQAIEQHKGLLQQRLG